MIIMITIIIMIIMIITIIKIKWMIIRIMMKMAIKDNK